MIIIFFYYIPYKIFNPYNTQLITNQQTNILVFLIRKFIVDLIYMKTPTLYYSIIHLFYIVEREKRNKIKVIIVYVRTILLLFVTLNFIFSISTCIFVIVIVVLAKNLLFASSIRLIIKTQQTYSFSCKIPGHSYGSITPICFTKVK